MHAGSGKLAIVGAGSWGTALAIVLTPRFSSVSLWCHDESRAREMEATRVNHRYLPGFQLPPEVKVSADLLTAVHQASIVVSAVPSAHLRDVLRTLRPALSRTSLFVTATKGLDEVDCLRMSEVARRELVPALSTPVAILSGPTFAREIAAGEPAAVVVACTEPGVAEQVQWALATSTLRLYTTTDVIGVELGGALKNVIAIAAGVCQGLGLGSNTVAALITRGLAEITRLAVSLGGQARTLSGLAGLGDLILTATGDLSRNRAVGYKLGQGQLLHQILSEMTMVAEGVRTCLGAYKLGQRQYVDLPIINNVHAILYENKDPRTAISDLMDRPLTAE
jgi:glycerol-3-phosphate dehydrogenase (NAD(P)+)